MAGGGGDAAWGTATGAQGSSAAPSTSEPCVDGVNGTGPGKKCESTIDAAKRQINEAVAASVLEQAPAVLESAQFIIDSSQLCVATRNSVLESLTSIFGTIDVNPWLELGNQQYFEKRREDQKTMYDHTYRAPESWRVGSPIEGDKTWGNYARTAYKERLNTGTLTSSPVSTHLWMNEMSEMVLSAPNYGPWDVRDVLPYSFKKWSWVSELDETFSTKVPDFGAFDTADQALYDSRFTTPNGEVDPFHHWHMRTDLNAIEAISYTQYGDTRDQDNAMADQNITSAVLKSWPFGWLTTLETAMAMIGYYTQASDQTLLQSSDLRSGPEYHREYSLFTERDIRHLSGDGDAQVGWNSIMDANHSNLRSWTKANRRPYLPPSSAGGGAPVEGMNTPENFVVRSFSEVNAGGKMCEDAEPWQPSTMYVDYSRRSAQLYDMRPYTMLMTGGVLNQGLWNSKWTVSPDYSDRTFFKPWTSSDGSFIDRTKAKLQADADRFAALATTIRSLPEDLSNSDDTFLMTQNQATVASAMLAMFSKQYGQTSLSSTLSETTQDEGIRQMTFIKQNDVYGQLSNLLNSVASFLGGTLDEISTRHDKILDSHRRTIMATCDAINEIAGAFNDDDDWYNIFDDFDDHMEDVVRGDIGNPFDQLGDILISTGATNVMFKEQCFLLSFIADFAASKRVNMDRGNEAAPATKRLPYYQSVANRKSLDNNATILMDGGSYGFLNKLTQNPKLTRFYNALNHELSNLQPKIRLWKVIFDEEGNEQEVEIKFESHFSAADLDMFKNSVARGVGAGLKSFNFVYDGSNPFSVKKSIKANLKIFANTMSEILRDRPSHYVDDQGTLQPTTYRYSDLAMKTWNTAAESAEDTEESATPAPCGAPTFDILSENTEKSELNFRLKAEVGFSQPINEMSSMHEKLREALSESFVTLNLTPTVHNFEIDEMGRVIFNLNFLAYIEQFFDQSMFNVFSSSDIELNRIFRKLMMKHYNSQGCDSERISQQKEDFATEIKGETEQAIASLIGDMMTEDLIYYVNLPYAKITSFLSYGPHSTYDDFIGDNSLVIRSNAQHNELLKTRVASALSTAFGADSQAGTSDAEKNQIQAALLGNDPREADLSFFYLSDLIDMVLVKIETGITRTIENIDDISLRPGGHVIACEEKRAKKKDYLNAQKNLKKLRIMLGPMELSHPKSADGYSSVHVNLGDCPISVKYFVEWLTSKMLQKDEVTYNLTKFVNDLINNLIRNFLNNDQCFGYSVKQKTRLNQSAISSYGAHPTYDPVTLPAVAAAEAAIGAANASMEATATEAAATGASVAAQVAGIAGAMAGSLADGGNKANFRARLSDYEMPVLNPSGPSNSARTSMPVSNEYNYFVYFAGRVMPTELMKGEKQSDEEKFGIFHYMLGRDRGLVKNIKLTKTQTKGLAEVRFEQSGYDGLQQLRVTYDAQVDMFASVNTFPGTYIYIDPRGFAPEGSGDENFRLTSLGIGGYYMIIRSEHEFAEGKANTVLHTKWVNQVDGEESERASQMAVSSTGTGDIQSRKCSISLRPNPEEELPETAGIGSLLGF